LLPALLPLLLLQVKGVSSQRVSKMGEQLTAAQQEADEAAERARAAAARCAELEEELQARDEELAQRTSKVMQLEGQLKQVEELSQKVGVNTGVRCETRGGQQAGKARGKWGWQRLRGAPKHGCGSKSRVSV
jgi:DNA repair exonuclease SbcCD ATPase subunit